MLSSFTLQAWSQWEVNEYYLLIIKLLMSGIDNILVKSNSPDVFDEDFIQ